jgi:hypothetical protein
MNKKEEKSKFPIFKIFYFQLIAKTKIFLFQPIYKTTVPLHLFIQYIKPQRGSAEAVAGRGAPP